MQPKRVRCVCYVTNLVCYQNYACHHLHGFLTALPQPRTFCLGLASPSNNLPLPLPCLGLVNSTLGFGLHLVKTASPTSLNVAHHVTHSNLWLIAPWWIVQAENHDLIAIYLAIGNIIRAGTLKKTHNSHNAQIDVNCHAVFAGTTGGDQG